MFATEHIGFEKDSDKKRWVTTKHNALIAKMGTSAPGINDCATASLAPDSININKLPEGTYVCVQTSEDRYAQFQVTATVGPSPGGTLNISFITWD